MKIFRDKKKFQQKIGEQKIFFKEKLGERGTFKKKFEKKLYEINFKKIKRKFSKRKNIYIKK